MTEPKHLGTLDAPSRVVLLLDPGLSMYWSRSPEPTYDLALVGDDSRDAGLAYDREFEPTHLYDQRDPQLAKERFDAFASESGFASRAVILDEKIPYARRCALAIEHGGGLGVIKYDGLWAIALAVPEEMDSLDVLGLELPEDHEFARRWEHVDVVFDADVPLEDSIEHVGFMVDHGQLMLADLEALERFEAMRSLDGLGDVVFWGPDAEELAAELGASALHDDEFGWLDTPLDELRAHHARMRERIDADELRVGSDWRPHCNLTRLKNAIAESDESAASIEVAGLRVFGCDNRWGDGVFGATRWVGPDGRLARIRIDLGTPRRQDTMRRVYMRSSAAIFSRLVLDGDEPIRFVERTEPNRPGDSGWFVSSGAEDDAFMNDADNFVVVGVGAILERAPDFERVMLAAVGEAFRLDGDTFVPCD